MVLESAQNQIKVWPKLLVEICELQLNFFIKIGFIYNENISTWNIK